jgi:transcriptional regulator with XRE-family HTH domain
MKPKKHDIEVEIGARIRALRLQKGWTQQQLADALSVTYQQAHKYERGINRVSASRLGDIAAIFDVGPADLLPGSELPTSAGPRERMALEMSRAIAALDEREQAAVMALVRCLTQSRLPRAA